LTVRSKSQQTGYRAIEKFLAPNWCKEERLLMADTVMDAPVQPTSLSDLKRKDLLQGKVQRTELYGAFVDVGLGIDAILHVSQVPGGSRIQDILKEGETINVWVDKVDPARNQLIITMMEPLAVEWSDLADGNIYTGTIKRLENFGAFVDIGAEKEGLVHVSEISHDYIRHPSQAISVGDEVQVKVLSYSKRKRRINLSMKALLAEPTKEVEDFIEEVFELEEEPEEMPTAMEAAFRRASGDSGNKAAKKRGEKKRRGGRRRNDYHDDILERTLDYRR
jgi:predicted RNA-binding protein with RPS1 domain